MKTYLEYFFEISKISRVPGKEEKIADYLVNFAQLTNTDGSFIFGREPIENFDLTMLKGKSILGGRAGGVPEMTLEYVLKKAGLTIAKNSFDADVNVRTDVAFDCEVPATPTEALTLRKSTTELFLRKSSLDATHAKDPEG